MTSEQTAALVSALITTWGILNSWLVWKAKQHDHALDGVMGLRIATGATAAIASDHAARSEPSTQPAVPPAVPLDPIKAARIAALERQIEALRA